MTRDASASPPYKRVSNISQYTLNNPFNIYLEQLSSSVICSLNIRNQNMISVYHCFKFEITLCRLVSSYILKPRPAEVK